MKYMTKEWYETMQKSSFSQLLRVSKEAEIFSEDYFMDLYISEEKAWLQLQEDISNFKFEDIYLADFQAEYANGRQMEPSAFEDAKEEYFRMREQERLKYFIPNFDPEQEKKRFKQALRHNVEYLKKGLPDEILQKVADLRVLALDRVAEDIKKEIKEYCKANHEAVELAMKAYWKDYKKSFKNKEPEFAEEFNFHDCRIVSCRRKGKDIVLTLDNSGGFTYINQVIFKNCTIRKQDNLLHGAWWLNDEIYKTNNGYEIHVLLIKNKLIDLIVTVSDVVYQ